MKHGTGRTWLARDDHALSIPPDQEAPHELQVAQASFINPELFNRSRKNKMPVDDTDN